MDSIRVLYITIKGLRLNGSQQLGLYVRRFSRGDFRCHVATYKRLADADELERMGVGAHRVAGLRGWRRARAAIARPFTLRALERIVREHRVGIVHSYQTSSAPYALALSRRTGLPHVVQFRNSYADGRHYRRYRLHEAQVLVALSDTMMERYEGLAGEGAVPGQRRVVIPNGIDLHAYRVRGDARDIRRELGLVPETPVVGVVGAISSRKDTLTALEVARRVGDAVPSARFVFVGDYADAGYQETVRERLRKLRLEDVCLMAGGQPDAAPYHRAFDLLRTPPGGRDTPRSSTRRWPSPCRS